MNFYSKNSLAADIVIERAKTLKPKPENPETVPFGHVFTDHMLEIDYDANNGGWGKPVIRQFGDLNIVSNLSAKNFHFLSIIKKNYMLMKIYREFLLKHT